MTHAAGSIARGGPRGQLIGVALIVLSACGFGSGALFVQPLYDDGIAPQVVLLWRFASAAAFSWLFVLAFGRTRRASRALPMRRVAILAVLGAIYVGNSYGYYASLQVVPITLSSIITYIYPAVVAVLATRFVQRLEGRRAWVALGLSMLGVAMALGGIPDGQLPPLWGLALAFASPLIYGVWIVLQARVAGDRPGRSRHRPRPPDVGIPPGEAEVAPDSPHPAPATAIMTTATAAVFAIFAIATGGSASPLDVAADAWLPLLAIGLLSTAFAIQAFYAGVRRIGGARAAIISTIEPAYTIVMAMILFGEQLTPMQLAGGALVILAVILAESGQLARARAPSEPAARGAGAWPRVEPVRHEDPGAIAPRTDGRG